MRLRRFYELTEDEKAVQLMHLMRKLRRALTYVVEQLLDDLGHYNGQLSDAFSFGSLDIDPVKVEIGTRRDHFNRTISVSVMVTQAPRRSDAPVLGNPNVSPLVGQEETLAALFEEFSPLEVVVTHDPCPYFIIAPRRLES